MMMYSHILFIVLFSNVFLRNNVEPVVGAIDVSVNSGMGADLARPSGS